ncbi:MAG: hypothetical protein IJ461_05540 [Clostridia bacterium]|nr:hypothetical protein [Clostridia bacterium]
MKKSLMKTYWVSAAITLLMALAAAVGMLALRIDDTRESLYAMLEGASAWTLETRESLQEHTLSIAAISPPVRATFLMDHGLVLADSHMDPLTLPMHYDRPEVTQALAGRIGESLRFSQSQGVFTLNIAKLVTPYLVLRLSYPVSEITQMLAIYTVGIVVLFFVLHALQRRSLERFSRSLIQQMEDVRRLMEGTLENPHAVFPELQPAMDHIAYLAQRLNDDMKEISRTLSLRNDCVANASHELRSPLTSIMGFAEMLSEGLADTPEEQALCIETIRTECERMLCVIEEILLLSRAERHTPQAVTVHMNALSREVCQALTPQAAEKKITLSQEGEITLTAPEKDVWEILYNLIDNAIRYGRQGGYVKVRMGEGRLIVEDNGIGIEARHLPRLFEQFYRVDEARDASRRGTGLGLSIVRALVERNGGRIEVESQLEVGTRFIVTFGKEAAP